MKTYLSTVFCLLLLLGSVSIISAANTARAQAVDPSNYPQYSQSELLAYLQGMLLQLQTQLLTMHSYSTDTNQSALNTTNEGDRAVDYSDDPVIVTTRSAQNIDENQARFRGLVRLNEADRVFVKFVYGTSRNATEETPQREFTDETAGAFAREIGGLKRNTRYYYRAVAETEAGDEYYGAWQTLQTTADTTTSQKRRTPTAVTNPNPSNIRSSEARIRGSVNMHDYQEGLVFFAFGEQQQRVQRASNATSYGTIANQTQGVNTFEVYDDFSGDNSFYGDLFGLRSGSTYYYRLCVEYERATDREAISCGQVERFQTTI